MAFTINSKCRLVLDSCCDLPRRVLDEAGVEFLQFPYMMNDGEHFDDLGVSMEPKEFYDRLRNGEVSGTAQIPLPVIMERFEEWAREGSPMVYLAFTGGLSGTFETVDRITTQLKEKYPDWECYVVDTLLASAAEGLLVYEAIHQYKSGLTAKQLADWACEARWFVHALFTCENLESLRRGGRVPDAAARFGDALDVKPMLSFNPDGSLALSGMVRGRKKSLKALVKEFEKDHVKEYDPRGNIIVASADSEEDAKWVASHLGIPKEGVPPMMCNIGPTIGSHVGPGMVAIVFWGEDRRKSLSIADRIANKFSKEQ